MIFANLLKEDYFQVEGINEIWVKAGRRALRYSPTMQFLGAHTLSFTTPVKRIVRIERIYYG
jgi:hypothetical protein